jgi:hypothetical protein
MLCTGCTGSFALTRKVWEFHRGMENKWVDELVFLVCAILPVYSIATLVDAVIINSIEFWSGENPVMAKKVIKSGDSTIMMTKLSDTQIKLDMDGKTFMLVKSDKGVRMQDTAGKELFLASAKDGSVAVTDANGTVVKTFSASDRKSMMI